MGQRTPLYQQHVALGAKVVDFGGWDMPLHYGSQVDEHHAVRQRAGAFDVSHMTVVDITGDDAREFLRYLFANDVAKLRTAGKALYSCMLNESGGVVDDLIVYFFTESHYRVVMNAATRDKDMAWVAERAGGFAVEITERPDTGMIAVQGPAARELAATVLPESMVESALALKPFTAVELGDLFVARTGYTGEDGWEIVLPADQTPELWQRLLAAGVAPAGLGARDTLRLEAGMHLYGTDMDDSTSPLESGLGWTVSTADADRDFVGRSALEATTTRSPQRFTGLLLEDRGVLRNHQRVVVDGAEDGEITSGGFSPTLGRSIAMARLPAGDQSRARVEVRNKLLNVRVVDLPFVRKGEARIDLDD
ncbi:MAG: glycine cleavage system aminomethyltransferase GcvT [Pseudomonadota bacterium]